MSFKTSSTESHDAAASQPSGIAPNFLHVPSNNLAAMEGYLHLYVDGIVRSAFDEPAEQHGDER